MSKKIPILADETYKRMAKYILIILLLLVSVIYIHGTVTIEPIKKDAIAEESSFSVWKKDLIKKYGISEEAVELAFESYNNLRIKKLIKNDSILSIIDFSKSSVKKRLIVLDVKNHRVVKNTWVAHGKRTGVKFARKFSNKRKSNKSSLGTYLTAETYMGKHGYSLRLDGMEKGINDNARKRAIVIHGADYVSENFIKKHGRLGRSYGCPALDYSESKEIIDTIKNGSCLFIYHPQLLTK